MIGKDYDEIAWNAYQADLAVASVTGKIEINKIAAKKFNYNTILAYEQDTNNTIRNITNAGSNAIAKSIYSTWFNGTHSQSVDNEIFENVTMQENLLKVKKETNTKLILLQTGGGKMPTRQNINGETVIDYRQAALVLSQEDFEYVDIDGSVIKSQDSLVQSVLKNYESRATAQESNDQVAKDLLQNKNTNILNTDIVNMRTDGKINENFPDDVRDAVDNEKITGKQGLELLNSYNTFLEEKYKDVPSSLKSWETEEAKKYGDYVNLLLFNGEIDSQSEWDNLIVAAVASGLLENDVTKINNRKNLYEENRQARADANEDYIKNAENFIKRSFGVDNTQKIIFSQQEGVNVVKNASPNELISYRAINNLNELVIAGLKKNIPIQEMLSDRTSSNYIIEDLITLYKTDLNNLKETEFANIATGEIQGFYNSENKNLESIKIDPNAWISTRGRSVPLKLENEGPEDYITRLQEYFKSTDFGGKSSISEGADNSFDLLMEYGGANDEDSFGFDFEDAEMSNE